MGLNFTQQQYELVFSAIRKYQHINSNDDKVWKECDKILDKLYEKAFPQMMETSK